MTDDLNLTLGEKWERAVREVAPHPPPTIIPDEGRWPGFGTAVDDCCWNVTCECQHAYRMADYLVGTAIHCYDHTMTPAIAVYRSPLEYIQNYYEAVECGECREIRIANGLEPETLEDVDPSAELSVWLTMCSVYLKVTGKSDIPCPSTSVQFSDETGGAFSMDSSDGEKLNALLRSEGSSAMSLHTIEDVIDRLLGND